MRFSIVTPSFRNSDWLKLCIASVADQGVAAEHIVQTQGQMMAPWTGCRTIHGVKAFVERDEGMYDAVNRGLRSNAGRNPGLPQLRLNSTCQAHCWRCRTFLIAIRGWMWCSPILWCWMGRRNYLFHRKVQTPLKHHTWVSHLPTFTCATFFRRKLIFEQGLRLHPKLRDVGDGKWVLTVLQRRTPMAVLRQFTSTFTMTGANMSARPNARREARDLFNTAPLWARKLKLDAYIATSPSTAGWGNLFPETVLLCSVHPDKPDEQGDP